MANFIVHPRLLETLTPTYPAVGSVQAVDETQISAMGQPAQSWSDVPGLIGIPCRIATISGNETRAANQIYATATHRIWLQGYYPQITAKHRFVCDGVAYNILLPNHDQFGAFTYLIAEVVV